jgi:hypothetical protein
MGRGQSNQATNLLYKKRALSNRRARAAKPELVAKLAPAARAAIEDWIEFAELEQTSATSQTHLNDRASVDNCIGSRFVSRLVYETVQAMTPRESSAARGAKQDELDLFLDYLEAFSEAKGRNLYKTAQLPLLKRIVQELA